MTQVSWLNRGSHQTLSVCFVAVVAAIAVLISLSCRSLFSSAARSDISDLTAEKRLNGFLLQIRAQRKFEDVKAVLTKGHWLIVTIPDARLDQNQISWRVPRELVDSLETIQFATAAQISMRLSMNISLVEVVQSKTNDILISLFLTDPD